MSGFKALPQGPEPLGLQTFEHHKLRAGSAGFLLLDIP